MIEKCSTTNPQQLVFAESIATVRDTTPVYKVDVFSCYFEGEGIEQGFTTSILQSSASSYFDWNL